MTLEELFPNDADIHAHFPYLLLEVDERFAASIGLPLDEAREWRPSSVKGLMYRVDPADDRLRQKRHVHVAANRHTAAKSKQVSWNDEGGRHDRHSFNDKLGARADFRAAARAALKLPPDVVLEWVEPAGARKLISLTESLLGADVDDRPLKIRLMPKSDDVLDDAIALGLPG